MKKVLLFSAALFVIALGMGVSASAETKKIGNFKYEYDSAPNGNDVWITKITPVTGSDISTLKIPSKIDGNKVIKLGAKDDTDDYFHDNIFGMYILEEDSSLVPEQIVSDVAKIKKIILPSGLKELTPDCFHNIQKGKTISVPKTLKKNIRALCNLQWKKVTINKSNKKYKMKNGCLISKSGKTFYGNLEKKKSIKIPNGVKTIAEGALFLNYNLKVVYIPKTVSKIKGKAFGTSKSLRITMQEVLDKYPQLDGVFCDNADIADLYLDMKKDETKDSIVMVGVDATAKQQEAIRNAKEVGVVSQQPYAMGYQTIWTALLTTAPKKSVEIKRNVRIDPAWIDSSNIDDPTYSSYLYAN